MFGRRTPRNLTRASRGDRVTFSDSDSFFIALNNVFYQICQREPTQCWIAVVAPTCRPFGRTHRFSCIFIKSLAQSATDVSFNLLDVEKAKYFSCTIPLLGKAKNLFNAAGQYACNTTPTQISVDMFWPKS